MNFCEVATKLQNDLIMARTKLKAGQIAPESVMLDIAIITQIEKLQNTVLKTRITERKLKIRLNQDLISPVEAEVEMIQCPDQNDLLINRASCLDYSGSAEHNESCQTCGQYSVTRKLLLPSTKEKNP